MKTLWLKGAPRFRRHDDRMPPGSGLVIAGVLSIMIWGIIAAIALLH